MFARRYGSLCNALREEFSIVPCESERESEDEPHTTTDVGLLPDTGNNLITKQIKQWKLIHVLSNALEPVSSVSHVVTRFCTDIRFTRLLLPICTLLIRTYSLWRFHKFPVNGLLVSVRLSRHGYAPQSEMTN